MFHDPIKDKPKKNDGLPYDERSSCFVNVGTHHGVGHQNPVGHSQNPKQFVSTLPQGRVKTMKDDDRG